MNASPESTAGEAVPDDRAHRLRLLALLGVLALLSGALALGLRDDPPPVAVPSGPDAAQLTALAKPLEKSGYGKYLLTILKERVF